VESESEGILGGVGRNFRWSQSQKKFLGGVRVRRNFRWSWSQKEFYVELESVKCTNSDLNLKP
jgi:hypothetical protein